MTQHPAEKILENDTFISRIIHAPRELVFAAWTDPEHLKHWFAPKGCTIHFTSIDIRPGGGFHLCIRNPDYKDCWCKGTYLEIIAPERIVYKLAVSDEAGRLRDPKDVGMDPEWPAETIVTATFKEMGITTKFTLHQTVSQTIAKRTGAFPSWLSAFDLLDELLKKQSVNSI